MKSPFGGAIKKRIVQPKETEEQQWEQKLDYLGYSEEDKKMLFYLLFTVWKEDKNNYDSLALVLNTLYDAKVLRETEVTDDPTESFRSMKEDRLKPIRNNINTLNNLINDLKFTSEFSEIDKFLKRNSLVINDFSIMFQRIINQHSEFFKFFESQLTLLSDPNLLARREREGEMARARRREEANRRHAMERYNSPERPPARPHMYRPSRFVPVPASDFLFEPPPVPPRLRRIPAMDSARAQAMAML